MGAMQGDDLQLNGDLACANAEVRGELTIDGEPVQSGVAVEDQNIPLPDNPHRILNFVGGGVSAADAGGGRVTVSIPGGGAGTSLKSDNNPLANNPYAFVNIQGNGVTTTDGGSEANVDIPGTLYASQGVPLAGAPHTAENYVGGGVTATDAGGGVVQVEIPGMTYLDEGAPLAGAPHIALNVVGAGAQLADAGGGVAVLTVPGQVFTAYEDEGVAVPGAPHATVNFVGGGITATDAGGGVLQVSVPAAPPQTAYQDEGVAVPGAPHTVLNFVGNAVTVSDAGGGVARALMRPSSVLMWGNDNIEANANVRYLTPGYSVSSIASTTNDRGWPMPYATSAGNVGVLRNLIVRHNIAIGNGNSVVYDVLVNGVATGITVTVPTNAVGQATDSTHTFNVNQGDIISLRVTKALAIGNGNLNVLASLALVQ